ncbi:ROK family transcriptional regulator [Enterococcus rivorum]|uniref:MarR family transcriptional regulator n=1 Tax=Enterococcus rivorum TaxID=762845 RepID=A0A1E5KY19_9ENTE|nr:ROK family transcriptional regulator [Enterococcus rivorum]MBP2099609.1 putative NBD/HSP70 family sugar kinase [Enterococcus rivorum]OEH82747.1 MarR family transcriptional regulator [Enterococcus rivorum]
MITSKYSIREQNEATILKTIIDKKIISRAELSVVTGLNKASVSSITKTLLEEELVTETGIGDGSTSGGRKPILLEFNGQSALSISFDIGYNYVEALLSYLDGTELETVSQRKISVNTTNVVSLIKEIITQFEQKIPKTKHGIIGVTIAIHGIIHQNKIVFTPYYDLDQMNLYEELTASLTYPIYLENEANLAALGEYTFSSTFDSLVSLSIHSGIGAGIVEDGKLQLGKHGKAGEIGHSILYPHGRQCPCGNHGCLEQYASNKVLYDTFSEAKGLSSVNSKIISEAYHSQDPAAVELINNNCFLLSIGINNIVTLYDPEIVIINSSLYREIPTMIELVKQQIESQFSKDIIIKNSSLKNRATLYGCITINAQHFLNVQKLKLEA